MANPIEVTCEKCGKVFKVEYIADWQYSKWCDKCICKDQPRDTSSPAERRDDAKLDYLESLEEDLYL